MSSKLTILLSLFNFSIVLADMIVINTPFDYYQIPALFGMLLLAILKFEFNGTSDEQQAAQIGPLIGIMYYVFYSFNYPANIWNFLIVASLVFEFLIAFHQAESNYRSDTAFFIAFAAYAVFNSPSALVWLDVWPIRVIGAVIGYGLLITMPYVADNNSFIQSSTFKVMRNIYFILLVIGYGYLFITYFQSQETVIGNIVLMINLSYPVIWSAYLWIRTQLRNRKKSFHLTLGVAALFLVPVGLWINFFSALDVIIFLGCIAVMLGILIFDIGDLNTKLYFCLKFGFSALSGIISYLMQVDTDQFTLNVLLNFTAFIGLALGLLLKDYKERRYLEQVQPTVVFMMPLKMIAGSIFARIYYYNENLNSSYMFFICGIIVIGEIHKEVLYQFAPKCAQVILGLVTLIILVIYFISQQYSINLLVILLGIALLNLLEIYSIHKKTNDEKFQNEIKVQLLDEEEEELHNVHDKQMINLNCFYLDGKKFSMKCSELDSGLTLKKLIKKRESYENVDFKLMFNDKIIQDNKTLISQKIKNESSIAIIFVSSI